MPKSPRTKKTKNPLFVKVLEELRDEARAEKNIPRYYNYCKAVRCMKNTPFVIDLNKCKDLPYFGHYTYFKFKEKLGQYFEDRMWNGNDRTFSEPDDSDESVSPRKQKRNSPSRRNGNANGSSRTPNQEKPYVPRVGSGAYAILITMLKEKESFNYRGYSVKEEIIEKGQVFANNSMRTSTSIDPIRRSYTAFNGMKTLQAHDLVFTVNTRPIKYKLSEKGVELAQKLRIQHEKRQNKSSCSTPRSLGTRATQSGCCGSSDDLRDVYPDRFQDFGMFDEIPDESFWESPTSFTTPSKSAISSSHNNEVGEDFWEPVVPTVHRNSSNVPEAGPSATPVSANFRKTPSTSYVSLLDDDNDFCRLDMIDEEFWKPVIDIPANYEHSTNVSEVESSTVPESVPANLRSARSLSYATPPKPGSSKSLNNNHLPSFYDKEVDNGFILIDEVSEQISVDHEKPDNKPEVVSSAPEAIGQAESSVEHQNSDPDFEQLVFPAGSFEIELVVDYMETQVGSEPETIKELSSRLGTNNFVVRHLDLGDFLWVARHRETGKELVLPYIVERKRMDDLAESMRDGRYNEQKFRLRKCGLPNVTYLVEKFGSNDSLFGTPLINLRQAILDTQVIDGFFIKTTYNHKGSMSYLSTFTKFLTDTFENKILYSTAYCDSPPAVNTDEEMIPLITYDEFSTHSKKNKDLSVKDMLMKHLLQLKGMSVQKASAIVQNFDTPRALRHAFLSSPDVETMIANLTIEDSQPVGAALSRSVRQLFTDQELL